MAVLMLCRYRATQQWKKCIWLITRVYNKSHITICWLTLQVVSAQLRPVGARVVRVAGEVVEPIHGLALPVLKCLENILTKSGQSSRPPGNPTRRAQEQDGGP